MKKKLIVSAFIALCASNVLPVAASNDNISYSFTIKAYQENSRSAPRYRSTSNINNKWKVKMTRTLEGDKTLTRYWLEGANGDNVSKSVDISIADGAVYTPAYSSASQRNVYLTAENNNRNGDEYTVSGYWDEETN